MTITAPEKTSPPGEEHLLVPVREIARITRPDDTLPTGLESYAHAFEAYTVWKSIKERHDGRPEEFNDARAADGRPGWKWSGSVSGQARIILRDVTLSDSVIQQIRRYLLDTGNIVTIKPGRSPLLWVAQEWNDQSPAQAARDRRAADAAEEDRQAARAAVPGAEASDPEDIGLIRPGQELASCRWCPETVKVHGDDGTVVGRLRDHERTAHPAEYWAATWLVCQIGRCRWGAPDSPAYAAHLRAVHAAGGTMPAPLVKSHSDEARAGAARLRRLAGVPAVPAAPPAAARAAAPAVPRPAPALAPTAAAIQAAFSAALSSIGGQLGEFLAANDPGALRGELAAARARADAAEEEARRLREQLGKMEELRAAAELIAELSGRAA
jgi:hypothetical protein